jgi:hypothetical protein
MTWVIGTPTIFGYAIGLSDIRVTFSDGSERDCLQKIYPVGRFIAAGFAGSVAIGFALMSRINKLLWSSDVKSAWNPCEVARWWQSDARGVFGSFGDSERKLGSQMIMLGAHPTENMGDAPWPRSYVYRFSGQTFKPVQAKTAEVLSIGFGSIVTPYQELIKHISQDESIVQLETGRSGGMLRGIVMSITRGTENSPTKGISPHLHICVVTRGQVEIGKNDRRYIGKAKAHDFIMPKVATSLDELYQIAQAQGLSATGASY